MARPARPAYQLSPIKYREHPTMPGYVQARGYFNDANRTRLDWTGSGKTKAAARRDLEQKVSAAVHAHRGGDAEVNHRTKLAKVAASWWDWKQRQPVKKTGAPMSAGTVREYDRYVTKVVMGGSLRSLPVLDANNIGRIERFLAEVADERGAQAARQTRKVLTGILDYAERRGAIPASVMSRVKVPLPSNGTTGDRKCRDADCDYDCGKRHLDTNRAFTADEIQRVMGAAAQSARRREAPKNDGEDRRTGLADVEDLTHFLFGTGVRISEALHNTAWADVDLDAKTVHVRGTKTERADRVLSLSDELAERLRARRERHGNNGLVFGVTRYADRTGGPRDRDNVLRALRRVFMAAGVPWAGSHTFRRTVATWMDESGAPLSEIANQLGHADTNVTAGYLGRKAAASRAASVMVLPKPTERPNLTVVA